MSSINYKELLGNIRSNAANIISGNEDVCTKKEAALHELSQYEDLIPRFFSSNGEADTVRKVYGILSDIDYAKNDSIPVIDVNLSAHIYMDYYHGMVKFANQLCDVISRGDNEKLEVMKNQLQTAVGGDSLFIDSVFGGSNNARKDEVLTDAISNVEFLIDFPKLLEEIKSNIQSVCCVECGDNLVMKECIQLVLKSSNTFCFHALEEVMDTYESILQKILPEAATPVEVESVMMIF